MAVWRPAPFIRIKALGLLWRNGCLLAAEVLSDTGRIKGVRPLGGSVEFAETWQQTLVREFKEELDLDITVSDPPLVMENIYEHEGETGHEILFIATVTADLPPRLDQDRIIFHEDDGQACTARWFDVATLASEGPQLFPLGLTGHLLQSPHRGS